MPDAAPDGLVAQAVAAHRHGRLDDAEALYREILSVSPAHFDALHMLGVLHAQRRDYPAAIALIGQATAIRPDNAAAHCNLAKALGGCGRLADAVESYDAALRIDPDQPEAQYNRGSALFTLRRFEEAAASYDEVLRLWPDNSRALNNRGNALRGSGRLPEALTSYDRALEIAPDFAEAWGNRGNALQTLGRLAESLESYDRAIALSPDFAEAYCNRGITLEMLGRLQESLESYDRALRITPDHAETYNNRGGVLLNLGRASEALASFDRALAIKPDYADAHVNAGMCRLVTGDFGKGWQEFEWRWTAALEPGRPDLDGSAWLGEEPLQGKTILLWCEQGLGDSIQFCRFAKVLSARGATVFLWVHAALESLMLGLEGPERILRAGERVPKTDYHCALLSVPLALKVELGSVPAERQYLFADPERVEAWSRKLGPRRRPRIGFACSGNANHRNDRNRSIPFAQIDRIIDGRFEFFCLQKDIREDDRALLRQRPDIRQFSDELGDFDDTAALIQHMDLIITVDTSIAHLAAALGRPVWILLPFNADWRWLLERTDSPWYPTALLLRQPASGDWESVLSDVTQRLAAMEFAASGLESVACDDAARAAGRRNRARAGGVLAQAMAAHGNGELGDAEELYRQVLSLAPGHFDGLHMLGVVAAQRRHYPEAIELFGQALAVRPDDATALWNLGNAQRGFGRLPDAVASYDRALRIDPGNADIWHIRGNVLHDLKRPKEALESYDRVLALRPGDVSARGDAAISRLLIADFARGWEDYECRGSARSKSTRPDFGRPMWRGKEPLAGKTILLWAEQGLGDTIQFCRFTRMIAARGARILLSVPTVLESLMTSLDGVDIVLRNGESLPPFDYYCPLPSLPLALGIDLTRLPAERQYLSADAGHVTTWAAKLGSRGQPRIGVVWSGNPEHKNDRNRSIPLEQFLRITEDAFEFVCLQKEVRDADRALLTRRPDIRLFCDELDDFSDTAALIQQMDLVITVDTAAAHLAGALGRPVWILLPFVPDWRWLLDRDDSPWYPTARLFRQPERGDWDSVLAEVARQLNGADRAELLAQAVTAHRQDRLADAEALYRRVLLTAPDDFDAQHMLGVVLAQRLNYPEAIELLGRALAVRPDDAVAHCNLGNALRGFGRPLEAIASYDRALQIDPGHLDALYNRGHAHRTLGRLEEAVADYDAVLRTKPDFPEALHYRGNVLFDLKRPEEALASYDHALRLRPDEVNALNSRGIALRALKRLPEALASYDRAMQISPELAVVHNNRAAVLLDLDRLEGAMAGYDRAVELSPDYADAYGNRAVVLQAARRLPEAIADYEHAIALRPDNALAHYNASMCRLLMGDFAAGWQEHQWRWKVHQPMAFEQPLWLGKESLRGKSIVLWDEQGFGDTIQFCRFARLVAAEGATVLLSVVPALRSLLAGVAGVTKVLQERDDTSADFHCPLLSLPLAFGIDLGNIPAERQYLHAEPRHVAMWRDRLGVRRVPRVGLAWCGNPSHKNDRHRSIALEQFVRLASGPFEFVSLQKEIGARDRFVLEQRRDIRRFDAELADFQDTAALLEHMDLVVTVDTVVAHLAAAMGRPVWLLLPYAPDWRWLLDRDDSPWYPTVRLFRQPRFGDWRSVIDRVIHELPNALE